METKLRVMWIETETAYHHSWLKTVQAGSRIHSISEQRTHTSENLREILHVTSLHVWILDLEATCLGDQMRLETRHQSMYQLELGVSGRVV